MIPVDGPRFDPSAFRFTAFGPPGAQFAFLPNPFGYAGPVANSSETFIAVAARARLTVGVVSITSVPEPGPVDQPPPPPATAELGFLALGTDRGDSLRMPREGGAYGFGGNDALDGSSGMDFIYGGAGDDGLRGGPGNDHIFGGDDHDYLYGNAGDDVIRGERGIDQIYGGGGNDTLYGGENRDVMEGNAGNDRIEGEAGDDTIRGGSGQDSILGGSESDYLIGEAGADEIRGGDGNDEIWGDTVAGDVPLGADGRDALLGEGGNDDIFGGGGSDLISGGPGRDILAGFDGDDLLFGDDGADQLTGGPGNDYLVGGKGGDIFDFSPTALTNGVDQIVDFSTAERDRLDHDGPFSFLTSGMAGGGKDSGRQISGSFEDNPDVRVNINRGIVKLVDISGEEDEQNILTAAGLRAALANGGEYDHLDLTASQRAVIYAASGESASSFKVFYVTGATNTAAGPTVDLMATVEFAHGSDFSLLM